MFNNVVKNGLKTTCVRPPLTFASQLLFWNSKWQSSWFTIWDDFRSDPTVKIVGGTIIGLDTLLTKERREYESLVENWTAFPLARISMFQVLCNNGLEPIISCSYLRCWDQSVLSILWNLHSSKWPVAFLSLQQEMRRYHTEESCYFYARWQ